MIFEMKTRVPVSILLASLSLALAGRIANAKPKLPTGDHPKMNSKLQNLRLVVSPRGGSHADLLPEQSAFFDLSLRNEGTSEVSTYGLDQNSDTPILRVYDQAGNVIREATHDSLLHRFAGDFGEPVPSEPGLVTIAPGKSADTYVDLWSYMDPLPKGSYQLGVAHLITPGSREELESARLPFRVVDASVAAAAIAYENNVRDSSVVLWSAKGEGSSTTQLLARLSTEGAHRKAQRSGLSLGPVDARSELSIGGKPNELLPSNEGWFAVSNNDSVQLIRHFRTSPQWRSEPVGLGISGAVPIPRFPDRGHALYLATGIGANGRAMLVGVRADADTRQPTKWSTPILAQPSHAACLFSLQGPVTVAMGAFRNGQTGIWSLSVDETGKIVQPEKPLYSSKHEIISMVADQRPGQPSSFYAVEMDPAQANRLDLIQLTLDGKVLPLHLDVVPGWPMEEGKASKPRRVSLEIGWDGKPRISFVTASGQYFGGPLDGSPLSHFEMQPKGSTVTIPMIAALQGGLTYTGFSDRGSLIYFGGR